MIPRFLGFRPEPIGVLNLPSNSLLGKALGKLAEDLKTWSEQHDPL
jgi:hypothetical protein